MSTDQKIVFNNEELVGGPVLGTSKEAVFNDNCRESLFEVKDKDGQTVLAVYGSKVDAPLVEAEKVVFSNEELSGLHVTDAEEKNAVNTNLGPYTVEATTSGAQCPKIEKLTNADIATYYQDWEGWYMRSGFLAAFAYWVVAQSPYDAPDITLALRAFQKFVAGSVPDGAPVKFTYEQMKEFINEKVFESIPEIEQLNHPKIDTGAKYMFCSRYDSPKPDYDFIDLGALARNVFYMLLRRSITEA